ncbi:MAG: glycosyl transferase [Mucilaginibacter sp.]|nr:glycosyl transferase [Mucilaginibacter sp.]
MKILFSQKINGISGSELYLLQILPELKKRGYDVEMLLIYPTSKNNNALFKQQLVKESIVCHEVYGHGSLSFLLLYKIYGIIKKGNYDIVQSNLIHADLWMSLVKLLLKKDLKIISVKHGYSPAYSAKYGYDFKYIKRETYYWIQRFNCKLADFNVTISNGLYNVYVDGEITIPQKIQTVHYGLTLTPTLNETAIVPQEQYLLITGRLIGFKGHRYLINAWKKVNIVYPLLKLCIVGDGAMRLDLEKMVVEAGLQNVIIFLGHVPNPHPLMKKCLFTIVSSTWEGFGLILLESWLHKKPIVAFDVPAMNEVIDDGVNGLLVKKADSNDLAEKIIYLLNNESLITEMGDNGYKKLNSYFTLKRMTDEMEDVYHAVNDKH